MKEYKIKIKELTSKIFKECCSHDSNTETEVDVVDIIKEQFLMTLDAYRIDQ